MYHNTFKVLTIKALCFRGGEIFPLCLKQEKCLQSNGSVGLYNGVQQKTMSFELYTFFLFQYVSHQSFRQFLNITINMDTIKSYNMTLSQLITLKERDDGKKNKTMASPSGSASI